MNSQVRRERKVVTVLFADLVGGTEPDVRAALEFYRRVRATRYVREGEALLAASA